MTTAVRDHSALACLLTLSFLNLGCGARPIGKHVLIYTKNGEGYVHKNIPDSVACLQRICAENNWTFQHTDDASIFSRDQISAFDVLVFSNTNNETFDTEIQKQTFQDYIRGGGAFVGIHSACGSERDWPWYWANLGGKFVRHAAAQEFEMRVVDTQHPSTAFLGPLWKWQADECYYMDHLNPDIHVLLAADLTTVQDSGKDAYPGKIFGDYFPLSWCHEFDGGRQWYTALGHFGTHYRNEDFIRHLTGGLRWVMDVDWQSPSERTDPLTPESNGSAK